MLLLLLRTKHTHTHKNQQKKTPPSQSFIKWGLCSASSHRVSFDRNPGLLTTSLCNVEIMVPSAHQVVVFAFFSVCALEETALSHSGRCADKQCFAAFLKQAAYSDAQKSCQRYSGQLVKSNLTVLADIFKSLPNGEYWRGQKEAVAPLQTCSSIAVSAGFPAQSEAPCHQILSGFLCQYPLEEPCGELNPAGGSQVIYTAPMAFEVRASQTFPPGTTATVLAAGSKHLESKHICFSGLWMKAPWNCEVMNGGCEHHCNKTTNACTCPAGQSLSGNGVTCEADPCARCAHGCERVGDAHVCRCERGYRLEPDGEGCVDVNECEDQDRCTREGEECVNLEGGFACHCSHGFEEEEGACVNSSICFECEHMLCVKPNGFYECACREGFRVRARDPTKCDWHCAESQCPPMCDKNSEGHMQCFCPLGYILDQNNSSSICIDIDECDMGEKCAHTCVNTPGAFRCSCFEGFVLHHEYRCLPLVGGGEDGKGAAPTAAPPIPATAQPALVAPYIKAGSALGITVFVLLCAALLFFLIHNAVKRCRTFDLTSLKHPNIDIFHLQQVTTETYKRLSF